MSKRMIAPLFILALVIAVGGCGGGGDSSSEVTINKSLSKDEFVKQANVACNEGKKQFTLTLLREAKEKGSSDPDSLDPETKRAILVASLNAPRDKIRDGGAPPNDEQQVKALVDAFQHAVDVIEEKELEFDEVHQLLVEISKPARSYGIPGCIYG